MAKTMFAERFLVTPSGSMPPEPAAYDEQRGISLAADGGPFVEIGAVLDTRTLTEAQDESGDDDRDRFLAHALHTDTRADGERPDAPPWAHTETAAPGEPRDYDRLAFLGTVTKAEGERDD